MEYFSHGKVLLTAEYAVLDGVKALALPTLKGQSLKVKETSTETIVWKAYTHDHNCWIDVVFDFNFSCIEAHETSKEVIEKLTTILIVLDHLSPQFQKNGLEINTYLDFPQNWGLGSSSTLINNLAQWLNINPYELLEKTLGGSGYDIAAAQSKSPLFYTRKVFTPIIETVPFCPSFNDRLYFVHLNQKRNSQEAILNYMKRASLSTSIKKRLEKIGEELVHCASQKEFNLLLHEHEHLTKEFLGEATVQERLFPDFKGQIKSLGAWGGDFILASGNEATPDYFQAKGYSTIINYTHFILA